MELPELCKRYCTMRFWAGGYFSTTSGDVTDDIIKQYLEVHSSERGHLRQQVVLHRPALVGKFERTHAGHRCLLTFVSLAHDNPVNFSPIIGGDFAVGHWRWDQSMVSLAHCETWLPERSKSRNIHQFQTCHH